MVTAWPAPGLYVGTIAHRRTSAVRHAFVYPLFMALLDISRIPALMAASRLTSYNRWNWASFHEADHFGDSSQPLRDRLAADAAQHGHHLPDGPVFMLTHLRFLGYCFNPVCFFYCYDSAGELRLVLAEVSNTFGESHNYWLVPSVNQRASAAPRYSADARKSFYVSPFMPDEVRYNFTFTAPAERLVVHMSVSEERGAVAPKVFDATLSLEYRPWTASAIRRTLLRHPFMTGRVIGAIHWEALRLWWKGQPRYSSLRTG